MSDHKPIGLTGEGFSREEADAIYEKFQPIPMTPEERKEYLAHLKRLAGLPTQEEQESPGPVEAGTPS